MLATSAERVTILNGLLDLRQELRRLGIVGFQWLSGSFVEDIELQERRSPNDVDVVSFIEKPDDLTTWRTLFAANPQIQRLHCQTTHHVDHLLVALAESGSEIVDTTRYWCGLFSHRRDDLWKGMLHVQLAADDTDDAAARKMLEARP